MMRMTETEAQALAAYLGRVRPDWDHPGIIAALKKAAPLGPSAAVAAAACRLAENLELRTPAILDKPGAHWAGTTIASRQAPSMCPEHKAHKAGNCPECEAAAKATDHSTGLALVRAALKDAPPPPRPAHPQPPATDLRDTRTRIDTAQEA